MQIPMVLVWSKNGLMLLVMMYDLTRNELSGVVWYVGGSKYPIGADIHTPIDRPRSWRDEMCDLREWEMEI